ncbi:MAG: hypothetical protein N3A02_02525, partial [Rectinema sp.]|nr:hypothetical protein [Rectinema sp.]
LFDADRGFTSSYRGIPSSVLYSQDTAGYYWSSLMTTLWLGGLDVLGFLSNGQSSDLTPRASIGMGAQVVALTRAAAVAWDTTNAPALLWGYLHFTRMGGFINRIHLDTSAYTPEGIVANTPVLIPFATYVQNLWPGNLRGCPRKSCDYFTKTGEMGTNAQYMQIPIQEQRNWNKANRILIDKNMAVLFWPKITCCRMCMLDLPESLYRHFNGKPNDEFFWALALPWTSNGEKEKVQREQKEQEERNEKLKEDAEKEMQEKEKEFAQKEERFQELEEKQKNGEELTQEEREEYDRLNHELGGEVSDEQVLEGEEEMSNKEFDEKKADMQKAQRAEFKRALKCFKK